MVQITGIKTPFHKNKTECTVLSLPQTGWFCIVTFHGVGLVPCAPVLCARMECIGHRIRFVCPIRTGLFACGGQNGSAVRSSPHSAAEHRDPGRRSPPREKQLLHQMLRPEHEKRMPVLLFLCYNKDNCKNRWPNIIQNGKTGGENLQKETKVLYNVGRLICKRYL